MKLAISLTCISALLIVLPGCEMTSTSVTSSLDSQYTLSDIRASIECDASYQCKVVGIGERLTCGGPREYIIYSTKHTDEQEVEKVVANITRQEKLDNEEKAPAVSCEPVMPVQTLCIANTCQAVPL